MLRRRPGRFPYPKTTLGQPAVGAGPTGETARAPLYVTRPWKEWPTPDVFPGPVFRTVVEPPKSIPALVEPTFMRKWPALLDILPNVAILAAAAAHVSPAPIDPTFYKRASPQIEQSVNIAVNLQTQRPAGTYTEPTRWRPTPLPPEIFPNLAIAGSETVPTPRAPLYVNYRVVNWPAPDVYPNVASRIAAAPTQIRAPVEPQLWQSPPQQPTLFPNLAALAPVYVPPAAIEPQLWKSLGQQPALFPNLAALIALPVYVPPPPIEPKQWKTPTPQIDSLLNIAAATFVAPVPLPPVPIEPLIWRPVPPQIDVITNVPLLLSPAIGNVTTWQDLPSGKWLNIDLYPNVAVRVIPPGPTPPPPIEPTFYRKWTWPPELFPNIAAKATA